MPQSVGLSACNFIKKRHQHGCFLMNIPKVLGTAFFVEQFQWLLINYVLVSERILKKESREIAFDLISLSHVQIKEPTSRSATMTAFVFLAKYLKQEVDDDLSVCMTPCGLAVTGDIKIY